MNILVTGASGFIGRVLSIMLMKGGHNVLALSRQRHPQGANPHFIWLAPSDPFPDADAIVNLAGEGIAKRRLGARRADELASSRTAVMELLAQKYEGRLPRTIIQASATGIYANGAACGDDAPEGSGFIASLCSRIEQGARQRLGGGGRLVLARFGVVMGEGGGLMAATALLPRI
ncbi:MAG: NAD-dependent epimerase/dehydratase family protein, partial [Succinivibrio sp.]